MSEPDGRSGLEAHVSAPTARPDHYEHPDDDRLAAFRRTYTHLIVEDLYPRLTRRFAAGGVRSFAELGGGRGPMTALLRDEGVAAFVIDLDPQMVAESGGPAVRADMEALPLPDGCVTGASAVNCLYFLDDPAVALREARRVLEDGGLFVAAAPSRFNDPELESIHPEWGIRSSFDAEEAAEIVGSVFDEIEVERWDEPVYLLPDRAAVADYLHVVGVDDYDEVAARLAAPLTITKRGARVWARA